MATAVAHRHAHGARLRGPERVRFEDRAALLARIGLAWHGIEAAIAIAAGIAASSIALIGFGVDSLIEGVAGAVLLWRFSARGRADAGSERRAQQLIALSFVLLAAYVAVESIRVLAAADHPEVSYIGLALAGFTAVTMPLLAQAKARVGTRLHSSSTVSEGRQTMICAYLSVALLIGLGANAAFGWWWADPLAALVIAAVAANEARLAWRGDACCF